MKLTPPQPLLSWDDTSATVADRIQEQLNYLNNGIDDIAALDPSSCTFESVFLALARLWTDFNSVTNPLFFYKNVSSDKEIRDAASEAQQLFGRVEVEINMRIDIHNAMLSAEKNMKKSGAWDALSPEDKRYVEKSILDGVRGGLGLPEKERTELTALWKELTRVCNEFQKNLNEENGTIRFTEEELRGVPKDVVSGYKTHIANDQVFYDVTYKYPDILPILKFAENPMTRQRTHVGRESNMVVNTPILDQIVDLRRQIATLLGYKSWADYRTEIKMVKSAHNVNKFLDDLHFKLQPLGIKERDILLQMKKEEEEAKGYKFDSEFYIWDYGYYNNQYIKKVLDLDVNLVKEYFPVSEVVPAVLDIYKNLLGIQFVETKGSTWHSDVQQFAVWEKDAKDENQFLGYFYLDLFPRVGKYAHAAAFGLLFGYDRPDGSRSYPVSAMVANLAKPTANTPALMLHNEVVTFFHEMGHVFHSLLSKTKYARFHGFFVARDFVEAPSQMLENWCWEPKVLEKVSSHYKTKAPLTNELVEKIVNSRYLNEGLQNLRQIFFAKFDIMIHSSQDPVDFTELWNSLRETISLVKVLEYCPGQSSFGHIVGYDAGYYGYLYSLVFAQDMYATVFKADPFDPVRGKKYRDSILRVGGSRDELDSLEEFLGRPPNDKAFLEELFGTAQASVDNIEMSG